MLNNKIYLNFHKPDALNYCLSQWPSKKFLDNRERKMRLRKRRANAKLFFFLVVLFSWTLITIRATSRRKRSKLHNMFWIADECLINFFAIKSVKKFLPSVLCHRQSSLLHISHQVYLSDSQSKYYTWFLSTSFNRNHHVDKIAKIFPSSESIFIVGRRFFLSSYCLKDLDLSYCFSDP